MSTRLLSCALSLALSSAALAAGKAADPALLQAARSGDLTALRARLKAGADVNAAGKDGTTPLIEAALHGQTAAAEALIAAGADIDANRRGYGSPLDAAERAGHTALAGLLREKGARSASGRAVGDTVCVRPWDGDGYCGTVEAASRSSYRIRITEVVGCTEGCAARAECSHGRAVGGPKGLAAGDTVETVSWCLTHTGVGR
jgi:uncharacterized protein